MIVDAYLSVKYHGPIFGGLIGGATGFMIGFMIDYIFYKVIHKRKRVLKRERFGSDSSNKLPWMN